VVAISAEMVHSGGSLLHVAEACSCYKKRFHIYRYVYYIYIYIYVAAEAAAAAVADAAAATSAVAATAAAAWQRPLQRRVCGYMHMYICIYK